MGKVIAYINKSGEILDAHFSRIRDEIKKLGEGVVFIDVYRKLPRSKNQNSYYWGVMLKMIADEYGEEDVNVVHEECKERFLRVHVTSEDGSINEWKTLSTTALTTKEFEDYCRKIRQFYALHGLVIPEPNQVEWL